MATAHEIIAAKRADIAARERALELEKAELAGMERMVSLLGPNPRAIAANVNAAVPRAFAGGISPKTSSGRQHGAISQRWRQVLNETVVNAREWVTPSEFTQIIKRLEGRDTTPSQVRRILEGYAQHGFVEPNSTGAYRVTALARQKFGFDEPSAFDALNENGPPEGGPDADETPISSNRWTVFD